MPGKKPRRMKTVMAPQRSGDCAGARAPGRVIMSKALFVAAVANVVPPTFAGMGPDAITFVGYLDTPEAIAGYQAYRDMHFGDRAVTPIESIPDIWYTEQSAFYVSPDIAIGFMSTTYEDMLDNFGVTGIPYMEGGGQLCHTGSWHFGVSPNTGTSRRSSLPGEVYGWGQKVELSGTNGDASYRRVLIC